MKILLSFVIISLFIVTSNAQSRTISKDEYEEMFKFAVSKTNTDYPVIFKVVTNYFKNGKTVRTITEINENQSSGYERMKKTVIADGKETNSYQITVGFGNVFCSDDGISWTSTKYECSGSAVIYGKRDVESVEYSVTTKTINGEELKIYRKYSVFVSANDSKKKVFSEEVSTIDSRGFFITVVDTEGTLDPKTVTLTREQSWVTKAKIDPIVAPIK